MRFLADAGVSPKTVDFLKQLGHEAVHVRTLGLERAADSDLVARAREDSRVVVTFDLELLFLDHRAAICARTLAASCGLPHASYNETRRRRASARSGLCGTWMDSRISSFRFSRGSASA